MILQLKADKLSARQAGGEIQHIDAFGRPRFCLCDGEGGLDIGGDARHQTRRHVLGDSAGDNRRGAVAADLDLAQLLPVVGGASDLERILETLDGGRS